MYVQGFLFLDSFWFYRDTKLFIDTFTSAAYSNQLFISFILSFIVFEG